MAKKNGKRITMDQLAIIINDGFNGQMEFIKKEFEKLTTKEELGKLDKKVDSMEKDVKYIKENIEDARKLEQRVDYIENVLVIKKD